MNKVLFFFGVLVVMSFPVRAVTFEGEVWDCSNIDVQPFHCMAGATLHITREALLQAMDKSTENNINLTMGEIIKKYPGTDDKSTLGMEISASKVSGGFYSETFYFTGITRGEIKSSPAIQNTTLKAYLSVVTPNEIILPPWNLGGCFKSENCSSLSLKLYIKLGYPIETIITPLAVTPPVWIGSDCRYALPTLKFVGNSGSKLHAEGKITTFCSISGTHRNNWKAGGDAAMSTSNVSIDFGNGHFETAIFRLNGKDGAQGIEASSDETVILSAEMTPQRGGDGTGIGWVKLSTP